MHVEAESFMLGHPKKHEKVNGKSIWGSLESCFKSLYEGYKVRKSDIRLTLGLIKRRVVCKKENCFKILQKSTGKTTSGVLHSRMEASFTKVMTIFEGVTH